MYLFTLSKLFNMYETISTTGQAYRALSVVREERAEGLLLWRPQREVSHSFRRNRWGNYAQSHGAAAGRWNSHEDILLRRWGGVCSNEVRLCPATHYKRDRSDSLDGALWRQEWIGSHGISLVQLHHATFKARLQDALCRGRVRTWFEVLGPLIQLILTGRGRLWDIFTGRPSAAVEDSQDHHRQKQRPMTLIDTYCAYVRMCVCVFAFKINHFVRSRDVFSICDLQMASTMKCDEIDIGCEAFLAKHPDFAELQKSYKGGWPCELEDEAAASQHGC